MTETILNAIKQKKLIKVKEYIEIEKVNVNLIGPVGNSLLHYAVKSNNYEITKYLLESSKDIDINRLNQNNNSILHFACYHQNIKIVELLLNYNIKKEYINLKNKNKNTPLYYSYDRNINFELIKLLIEYGGDINDVDKDGHCLITRIINYNKTQISYVVDYNPNIEIIKNLIDNGAHVESTFKNFTCLQLILCNGTSDDDEIIEYLINVAKADTSILTDNNDNYLHLYCTRYGSKKIIDLLLEKGIDITHKIMTAIQH